MDLRCVDWKDWKLYASVAFTAGMIGIPAYNAYQDQKTCNPVYEKFNAIAAKNGINVVLKQSGAEANEVTLVLGKSEGLACPKTLYLKP